MSNPQETELVESGPAVERAGQVEDKGAETSPPAQELDQATPPPDATAEPAGAAPAAQPAVQPILDRLEQLEQIVAQLSVDIGRLIERADLTPRQVRQLGAKVEGIAESVSQPRIRDLLASFLQIYDLVEQMSRAEETDAENVKNYRVLRDQIAQTLRVNGIQPIDEVKRFDPDIHKAVETVPCQTPEEDGEIVQVHRAGFRTERVIVRYVEVVVKRYQPSEQTDEESR